MQQGTVKWFNAKKGYGFITDENGEDHFFYFIWIDKEGFKSVKADQEVTFDVEQKEDGKTYAVNVKEV